MNIPLGTKIKARFAYARKASQRFNFNINNPAKLTPKKLDFTGFVVGTRICIMSDYKYHDGNLEDQPPWATGTKEKVLLVSKTERHEPLVVRFEDVL